MLQKSRELTKKQQDVSSSDDERDGVDSNNGAAENEDGIEDENDEKKRTDDKAKRPDLLKLVKSKAGGWLDAPRTTFVYTQPQLSTSIGVELHGSAEEIIHRGMTGENNSDETGDRSELSTLGVSQADLNINEAALSKKVGAVTQDNTVGSSDEDLLTQSGVKTTATSLSSTHEGDSDLLQKPESGNLEITDEEELEIAKLEDSITPASSQKKQNISDQLKKKKRKKKRKPKKDSATNSSTTVEHKEKPVKEITLQVVSDKIEDSDDSVGDDNEDDRLKVTMEELFQDEDVVEEFVKEKLEAEERSRPKPGDTKLPGWGKWAGPDYKDVKQNEKQKKK